MSTEQNRPTTPNRPLSERELVSLLEAARDRTPPPPANLLERLHADIPRELPMIADDASRAAADDGRAASSSNRRWFPALGALLANPTASPWGSPALRLAAAAVLLVGAGVVTFGVAGRLPLGRAKTPAAAAMNESAAVPARTADVTEPAEDAAPVGANAAPAGKDAEKDAADDFRVGSVPAPGPQERADGVTFRGGAPRVEAAVQAGANEASASREAQRSEPVRQVTTSEPTQPSRWWEALEGDEARAAGSAGSRSARAELERQGLARSQSRPEPPPSPPPAAAPAQQQQETERFNRDVEQHNRRIDELAAEQRKLKEELERRPAAEQETAETHKRAEARSQQLRGIGYIDDGTTARASGAAVPSAEAPLTDRDDARSADGAAEPDPPSRERIRSAPTDQPMVARRPAGPSFDGMYFRDYGAHPFVDPAEDPLSTFGLDVDTGSYTIGRRYLELGQLPPPASVRVEEWVNFFDYGDAAPRRGDFALTVEGARVPGGAASDRDGGGASYLVRIGVAAREVAPADRKSAVLVLLVDTSGSMARENRLGLVRQSLAMLLDELRADDEVALVTYGSQARVVLAPTRDKVAVRRALDELEAQGSTNLEHGMALAYELLARNHRPEALHRVILTSDGVANVGLTDPEALLRGVAEHAARGIELLAVGVGMGNYNDVLLERLADRGDGAYAYVDSLQEARRVFVDELVGTLQSVAGDARIQVAFDPEVVASYRLVGYANRDLPDQAFRDPRTDAGEIGSGHRTSALYEVAVRADAPPTAQLGRATLRWRSRRTGEFAETSAAIDRWRLAPSYERSAPSLRLAATVAELAEVLRAFDPGAGAAAPGAPHLDRLYRRAQALPRELPGRDDVAELARLVARARDIAAARE